MSSLVTPGPQTGSKQQPRSATQRWVAPFSEWFPAFLRDELKPYPGRGVLVLRYVLAATLTMLLIVTFRLPGAAVGGFYSLSLPRDSVVTTARAAYMLLIAIALSLTSVLLGAMLFVNYPLTHFLWVAACFFLGFYGLSVVKNYAAATAFVILISLTVPAWDVTLPTAALVVTTLWTAGSIILAALVTVIVEFGFSLFVTKDELESGLENRLSAVQVYLQATAEQGNRSAEIETIQQLANIGVSRLRQLALAGPFSEAERVRRSTAVSLVGRLVDLSASMEAVDHFDQEGEARLRRLARQIENSRSKLSGTADVPAEAVQRPSREDQPILLELEHTTELLQVSLSPNSGHALVPADRVAPVQSSVLAPDAWTNPKHLNFALRGGLAAICCYFFMNAVAWHDLGSSIFTVVVTATSSIGTSRQKQLLRFAGAIVGGVFFGIGSQVLILPWLDSITGFTILFVAVTAVAAWFITASPRISYFGVQIGLAFYLIQLRVPYPDTSFVPARDNLAGIMLGLVAMWLVFDTLGSKPAVQVMREMFAKNLQLMAQLAEPPPEGKSRNLQQIRTLRDAISGGFGAVNAQADAVLFELGASRQQSLALREQLLRQQPRLRSLFLFEIALLQYRTQTPPQELSRSILEAQKAFDRAIQQELTRMAQSFAGMPTDQLPEDLRGAYQRLNDAICSSYNQSPSPRARALLALSSHLVEVLISLGQVRIPGHVSRLQS